MKIGRLIRVKGDHYRCWPGLDLAIIPPDEGMARALMCARVPLLMACVAGETSTVFTRRAHASLAAVHVSRGELLESAIRLAVAAPLNAALSLDGEAWAAAESSDEVSD